MSILLQSDCRLRLEHRCRWPLFLLLCRELIVSWMSLNCLLSKMSCCLKSIWKTFENTVKKEKERKTCRCFFSGSPVFATNQKGLTLPLIHFSYERRFQQILFVIITFRRFENNWKIYMHTCVLLNFKSMLSPLIISNMLYFYTAQKYSFSQLQLV